MTAGYAKYCLTTLIDMKVTPEKGLIQAIRDSFFNRELIDPEFYIEDI